jgi:hypothetical protein
VQRHVFDRFRQTEYRGKPDDDRRDAAEQKQDLPTVCRHECRRHKAGNGAADRNAADRNDRQRRPQMTWRGFGVDGDHVGNDTADAEPRQQPQPEHLLEIGRIGGGKGEHAEPQVRTDQRGLAAIPVAHPSENRRAEENADEARAEHRPERARRYPPRPDQVRRGKGDRSDVIAVDQDDEERPDQQLDLE